MKCTIGRMKHRITIQVVNRTPDTAGGNTRTWSTHATVWASIEPLSAKERLFAGARQHEVTHRIRIRYLSTITTEMRISYEGRIFQVHGIVNEDEDDRFQVLNCVEGVAE